jgi:predicted metalloendopeptidase
MGELISDLKKAFTETLSNLRWLEDSVKKTAIEKLEKMAVWVGGPFDVSP